MSVASVINTVGVVFTFIIEYRAQADNSTSDRAAVPTALADEQMLAESIHNLQPLIHCILSFTHSCLFYLFSLSEYLKKNQKDFYF